MSIISRFLSGLRLKVLSTVEQVRRSGRELVSQISSLLTSVADIHVARHVDIDGIRQESGSSGQLYVQTVENARLLVRTLETVFQSAFNDCASFFLTLQTLRNSDSSQYHLERNLAYDHLDALSSSLNSNLTLLLHTLDSLLSLGHEQAEMAQGDYNGSIEWRMSLVSVRSISDFMKYGGENPDVVDMEAALVPQGAKSSQGEPLPYRSHNNQSRTDGSDTSHTLASSSRDFESSEGTLLPEDTADAPARPSREAVPTSLFNDNRKLYFSI